MPESIGLQALLDLDKWSGNVNVYLGQTKQLEGATKGAADSVKGFGSILPSAGSALGSFGAALGNVATIASGIIVANVFSKIADGVGAFVANGIRAVGAAQELEVGLGALLTQSNLYERVTEQVTTAQVKQLMSTDELAIRQQELTARIATQKATYQEQEERIRQLTEQYGANGLVVLKSAAQHNELALSIQDTERELAGLTTTQTTYGTETRTSYKQVTDFATAQRLAAQQSERLLSFVDKLSIISPFEQEQVALITKYAVSAGLGEEATKKFTSGFLDLAAGVGIGSESLAFAGDQLLQVAKVGKLTEIDLRQLRRLGIDLEKIIGTQMGMTIEEFNAEAEKSPDIFNKLFDAVGNFSADAFAGSAQKMATSVGGLQSTFKDILNVGGRELFRPVIEAVSPAISDILGKFTEFATGGQLAQIGQDIASMVMGGLSKGRAIFRAFGRSFDEGFRMIAYQFSKLWPIIQPHLTSAFNMLTGFINSQITAYAPVIATQLQTWATGFWSWVTQTVIPQIPSVLGQLTTGITSFLVEQWPAIQAAMQSGASTFWAWVQDTVIPGIGVAFAGVVAGIVLWASSSETQSQMNTAGLAIGAAIINGVSFFFANIDNVMSVLGALTAGLAIGVLAIGGSLIAMGGQIVAGIIAGMTNAFGANLQPWTISQFLAFAGWIGAINWAEVGGGIMAKINEGIAGMVDTVKQAFANGIKAWKGVLSSDKWVEVGANVIKGILAGINQNTAKVLEVLKELAEDALNSVMNALGISSPSTETAWIAEMMVLGAQNVLTAAIPGMQATYDKLFGIDRSLLDNSGLIGAARDDVEKYLDSIGIESSKSSLLLQILNRTFRQNSTEILGATNRVEAFQKVMDRLAREQGLGFLTEGGGIDPTSGAISEFVKAFEKRQKEAQTLLQKMVVAGTSKAVKLAQGLVGFGQAAAAQLDARVDTLAALLNTGASEFNFEGQIISETQAQLMLNSAMEEQASIQDDLLQLQQSQAKLGFLQQQLDLIKQLNDAGLNASDVLGGLQLGEGASVADMVEASNRAIEAIIAQAQTDLSAVTGLPGGRVNGLPTGPVRQTTQGFSPAVAGSAPVSNRSVNLTIGSVNVSNGMDANNLITLIRRTAAGLA